MKRVSFVESTVGTVKSIYRRNISGGKLDVSIKLTNCKRILDKDNHEDENFKFLIRAENKELVSSIKRGDVITIKEANNTIINILEGEKIPPKGKTEFVESELIVKRKRKV